MARDFSNLVWSGCPVQVLYWKSPSVPAETNEVMTGGDSEESLNGLRIVDLAAQPKCSGVTTEERVKQNPVSIESNSVAESVDSNIWRLT